MFGYNRGKSPAEVLIADPGKRESLLKDREYLRERVDKYSSNQAIIDGIDDAIALLDSGSLANAEPAEAAPVITIYEQKYKYLSSTRDSEGRCKVYSIRMACDLSRKYPFIVELENAMGVVAKTATGASNVSSLVNIERTAMHLTDGEFVGMTAAMDANCKAFQYASFMSQYEKAQNLYEEAKNKTKKNTG